MERKNLSAEEIALSLAQYEAIVENSPLYIFKIDREYKITFANTTLCRDFNLKEGDLIGQSAEELGYSPEIYNKWYEHYENAFQTGHKSSFEIKLDDKGPSRFFKIFLSPEVDEFGEVHQVTLYMVNSTDMKLIEDERDYIFNFSLDMFAIQTIRGDFIKLNPSWSEVLDWSQDKLTGTNWLDHVHPEDLYRSKKMQSELEKYNLVVSHETRFRGADGNYVWLEWNSIPIKHKDIVISVVRNISKWKHVNDKLRDSEKRYREVVETANYLLFSTDLKGNMLLMNNPGWKITGFKEDELINTNLLNLVEPTHRDLVKSFYKEMVENTRETNAIEFPIVKKSGELVWLAQNAKLKVKDGVPTGIDFIARDITVIKDVEDKLRHSEKRLRSVVNSSNEVLVVVDREGVLKDANDTAYEMLNLLGNGLLEKDFRAVLKDSASVDLFNTFINRRSNLETLRGEFRLSIEGYRELQFSVKAINYDDGNDNVLLFLTDITEIRQAQRISSALYNISRAANLTDDLFELYEYVHTQLQTVLDARNFAIGQIDRKIGKLVFPYYIDEVDTDYQEIDLKDPNSFAIKVIDERRPLRLNEEEIENFLVAIDSLHGTASKSWLGVPLIVNDEIYGVLIVQNYELSGTYSEEDEKMLSSISEILASTISKMQYQDELEGLNEELEQRVAERTIQLENTLENLNFENEERKKAQEELQKAQKDLQASLEAEKELHQLKSKFIAMVSHEYRTPLTAIMSSVNLLKNYFAKMTQEQINKQYKNISSSVVSMTNLLDDVLMIGKTENVQALNIIEFDLVNSVQALVENAKFIDNGKHIYEMNMPEKLLVRSDKKLLDHAISNLISNAVKYSENGTTVTVSLSLTDEAHLKIEIKDQGIGIPEEDIGRVFESFYRSHNTGSIEGTGLGMSIVKRSVDSLGGTIDVQSKLGEGTKISMIIPKVVVE